ncbi:MAG: beta-glucuronidase [Acidothermaceae bacterium]
MLSPRWTDSRTARRLDGIWDFTFDPESRGTSERWWLAALPSRRPMPVPASYNDLTTDIVEREHVGDVWYQTTIAAPRASTARRTVLRFDAATHRAEVWLNEVRLGSHEGGYTPFEFDVTHLIGNAETARITVRVDNQLTMHSIPPGIVDIGEDGRRRQRYFHDFYNYAGLSRSVWLLSMPIEHIADVTVTTGIDGRRGLVDYAVELAGAPEQAPAAGRVSVVLLDADGARAAVGEGATGRLVVDDARLWSTDDPYLYKLEVRYQSDDETDVYPVAVGVRTVSVDGARLLLNGVPIELRGFGMHEDAAWRGKGHDDARMVRDFTLLRWIGANSFRTSHYPYAEEMLDLADRLGFLVIDECAAVGLNLVLNADRVHVDDTHTFRPGGIDDTTLDVHLAALRELVNRDKNHPSVVMWSVANEPDTTEPASRPYFEALAGLTRAVDATRPVAFANVALATPDNDQVTDLFDVVLLNRYFGWYVDAGDLDVAAGKLEDELRLWAKRYEKPIVISEFGADAVAGVHSLPAQMWSEEFQRDLVETYLDVFSRVDEVVGAHVWNFADFATMQGANRVVGNRKGVFTREREPKLVAYLLRKRWAQTD